MGEMAEAIVTGACCAECGVFFRSEHGFPVLCAECWKPYKKRRLSAPYPKATKGEL